MTINYIEISKKDTNFTEAIDVRISIAATLILVNKYLRNYFAKSEIIDLAALAWYESESRYKY